MQTTALELLLPFEGLQEVPGTGSNPLIAAFIGSVQMEMGGLTQIPPASDETPWCASVPAFSAKQLGMPRPAIHTDPDIRRLALRARSWLVPGIGIEIAIADAKPGWDLAIFNRAGGPMDPTIINAAGHVGFVLEVTDEQIFVFGGNQGNSLSRRWYPRDQLLGCRRLWTGP